MLNHTEVINYIIQAKGFDRYLEIGCQYGKNFDAIKIDNWLVYHSHKHTVDPDPKSAAMYVMTSDEYFKGNPRTYDLIFIDGLHTAEQVRKDFINAMGCLSDNGVIVVHDTNPTDKAWTIVPRESKQWTGDVYKFICMLDADFVTLPFDYGITVVKKSDYLLHDTPMDYELFDAGRNAFLNMTTIHQFKNWL